MLTQIIHNTPSWVGFLLIALLWLGHSQSQRRLASLPRITLLPLIMVVLSLQGTVHAFGAQASVLAIWLSTVLVSVVAVMRQPLSEATRFDATLQRFDLPGSWVPLFLILGIFFTKYAVGVLTAMHPELVHGATFSLSMAALYGAFSGVFLGRAARLLRLSRARPRS